MVVTVPINIALIRTAAKTFGSPSFTAIQDAQDRQVNIRLRKPQVAIAA